MHRFKIILFTIVMISVILTLGLSLENSSDHQTDPKSIRGNWRLNKTSIKNKEEVGYRELFIDEKRIVFFGGVFEDIISETRYFFRDNRMYLINEEGNTVRVIKLHVKDSILKFEVKDSLLFKAEYIRQKEDNSLSMFLNGDISKETYRKAFFFRGLEWKEELDKN